MEYVIFYNDESFDYGDFTYTRIGRNGFNIFEDDNGLFDITSLEGFGEYAGIENDITTKEELIEFINQELSNAEDEQEFNRFVSVAKDEFIKLKNLVEYLKKENENGEVFKKVC